MSQAIAKEKLKIINELLLQSTPQSSGFLGGSLGLLFYYFNASKTLNDNILYNEAQQLLHNVFSDVNNGAGNLHGSFFSNGAAGLGYTINYLQQNKFIQFNVDDEFVQLDNFLYDDAILQLQKGNTDYLHGAMGILHYFTTRVQTPVINKYLLSLVTLFCKKAEISKDGIWFANLGLERLSNNTVDFGLAHGLSGFILILMNAWHHVNNKDEIENTIRLAIEFILKHELPVLYAENEYSSFPFNFEKDATELSRNNRLAWCYGDLSIVLLLYRAGNMLGDSRYTANADRLGMQIVTRKTVEATCSTDSLFCHGSAGLAQMYKALYNDTFNYTYYAAYEYWVKETLQLIDKEIAKEKYANNPSGLLEGWAGVGCVLSEYISREPTPWAKAFLL